jgi:glycosyltransferase involved in cell wall biosynthesis
MEENIHVVFLLGEKKGVYLNLLNSSIPILETGGTTFYHYLRAFPKYFKTGGYSHIFTATHYTGAAAIISKKISGVSANIYFTHHYSHPEKRPLKHLKGDLILKFIHYFITPHAFKIIAVSKGSLVWLRKFSRHPLPQGIYIHNPVFDDTIYSLAKEPIDLPTQITNKIILMAVGRLSEQKDHLTLLKAFIIFKQSHPTALLFILGTGPLQSELEDFISQHKISSSVFLSGFQPNPYQWISKCNVFVLSSLYEGFGNVIVEAMALGKTVVSTDCPSGPAEILQDGKLGYLCPVNDPYALSSAILKALNLPYSSNLLKEASQQYTVQAIVKKYIEIL